MRKIQETKRSIISMLLAAVLLLFPLTSCESRGEEKPSETEEELSFNEFQWPKSDIAALISVPESNIGRIDWEASYGFVIYVAETSKEDYDAYVDDCWDRGFTIDYSKGNDYFWANNEGGYKVTVRFDEDNVMFIRMDDPPDDFKPADTSSNSAQSGFDPATNQTVTFWGMEFSFPAYFDVRSEDSTYKYEHYYPEKEDWNCSLLFFVEDAEGVSQEDFDELKAASADAVLKERLDGATEIDSESATIGGLSGWSISCRQNADSENPSTTNYSFVYNPDNEKVIYICMAFDDADTSNNDYVEDYQKILASAKLVSSKFASGIRPEFKEAMDSYETFFDEYAVFMKKYAESSDPASLLSDYTKYMAQYADTMSKFETIDENKLSTEELEYYRDTLNRVSQKLLEVGQ